MSDANSVNGSQSTGGNKNWDEKEIYFYLKEIVFVFVLKDGMCLERFFLLFDMLSFWKSNFW